jgi:hypothetical protein
VPEVAFLAVFPLIVLAVIVTAELSPEDAVSVNTVIPPPNAPTPPPAVLVVIVFPSISTTLATPLAEAST